uniref:Fatty acyl-CoA reductase n=1 Tax=Parascaris univalens TaxID=6257 RepID=A0A914ZEZ5_PARUN
MEVGQRVADTFKEQSILVTGASGFLGKVLVEKLLYSTPELKNIYLLIRPQGGLSPKKRLDKILQGPLFDRLRTENPSAFSKLVPIGGNLLEEDLGLSQPDMHRLCEEVGIVFHCAATVKFDEALRLSIEMNVMGTQRLIALCHKMRNLLVVVHASTAYANCDKSETIEAIYPPPIPPSKLLNAIDWMDDKMLKAITPHLLAARPNTYTLTKALAEVQLAEDARMLPLIIVRPSIIGAMWREPLPGWTDNINGPTGIFAACGKGLLTNMCGNVHCKADIVPVDVVSNMLVVAAAYRATSRFDKIPVMHCCSGELNPIKWKHIVDFIKIFYRKYPLNECYRVPSTHFHSSRFLFELNFYYKHLAPAYLIDFIYRLTGRKQQFVRIYGKVWRMIETLHYFTTHGWNFESKGLLSMWDSLCDEDKEVFNFDVRQLDWNSYLFDYLMGVKRYVIKERLEDIPKATRNLLWLKLYSAAVNAGFWWLFVRTFARRRMKKTQWGMWAAGFALTYIWSSFNFGERVHLKSLEEYKRTTHCC